ncbi:uncharacterized protein LOC122194893 [Lactuca sativa]|uniref:uncharacterized protein LOC122194893 n=1 Tax=Lactuca sativa TaxID=4236 RepID=UPI0022B03AF3|nr:uncharacterized protein LOC122194893 [Lactuca sativa]
MGSRKRNGNINEGGERCEGERSIEQRRKRGYGTNEIRWREGCSQARGCYSGRLGRSRRWRRLRCLAEPNEGKRRNQQGSLFLVRRLQSHRTIEACSGGRLDRRKGTVHGCRQQQQRRGETFRVLGLLGTEDEEGEGKGGLGGVCSTITMSRPRFGSSDQVINNRKEGRTRDAATPWHNSTLKFLFFL